MLDTAGSAAAPAARCRNRRRGSFILNPPSTFASFDHLVGKCEQRVRYVEPHRLCGFQIEHEQEARRLLDRQVGGFSAFEDAIDQGGRTLENLAPVRSIRHQAAFTSERIGLVNRWQPSLGSVLEYAPAIEKRGRV